MYKIRIRSVSYIGIQIEVRSVSVSKGLRAAMLDAMSFPARAGSARAELRLRLRIRRVRGCGLGPGCPSVGGYPYIPPQSREVPVLSSILWRFLSVGASCVFVLWMSIALVCQCAMLLQLCRRGPCHSVGLTSSSPTLVVVKLGTPKRLRHEACGAPLLGTTCPNVHLDMTYGWSNIARISANVPK